MFFLHASNKTENLLQHLAAVIEAEPLTSLFAKEYIVIQSQGIERLISQTMADHFTSWCNYTFLLPVGFLQDIATKLGMQITPDSYDRSHLCWRIEEELHDVNDKIFAPLKKYLEGYNSGLRRYQLARHLANIFDQYQLLRPDMLKSWQRMRCCTGENAEKWQIHLWNRLVAAQDNTRHRGELLDEVIEKLNSPSQAQDFVALLPQRVSIFGLHILPPIFLDYLNGLSLHCDVHLYLLSPCKSYWGDMVHSKTEKKLESGPQTNHPLLESCGKQGRDFQDLLLEKVDFNKEIVSYDDPLNQEKPSLLNTIQADLLEGHIRKDQNRDLHDKSVRIISCHSKLRELEVLKDHILAILHDHNTIKLRDIVVMAPDIQDYAPFIPTIFKEIQHSIADRSLFRRNSYIAIFKEFLDLFKGRFGWSEVLDIFEKEPVYSHFGIAQSEVERVKDWIISSGIRWGLSRKTRKNAGFEFATNSWQAGLERLLMGYTINTDQCIAGIHPFREIEGGDAIILGGVCEFVDIIRCSFEDFDHAHNLQEWSILLISYIDRLFGKKENRELLELIEVISGLSNYEVYYQHKVDIEVVCSWLEDMTTESRSTSGFLKGQLTFCSMLPMRSIPFAVICLLGMNYGEFPKNDRFQGFDLMKRHPMKGDRSHRSDDRYQFLEAILSARQSLYISYVGQSLENNDEIPPAVVVNELLDVIHKEYQIREIVEVHPLHGFSNKYFTQGSPFSSYSKANLEIAKSMIKPRVLQGDWWSGKVAVEVADISFAEVLKFYAHPQRYFVNETLGLRLSDDLEIPDESETFATTILQSYHSDSVLIDALLKEEDIGNIENRLKADGLWSLGNPGELLFQQKQEELTEFLSQIGTLELGEAKEDIEFNIAVGAFKLQGKLSNLYERGILLMRYAKLKGKDLLTWWLHHLIAKEIGLEIDRVYLQMKDADGCIMQQNQQGPNLEELLQLFVAGRTEPSSLFIQPAVEYCQQTLSTRASISPLQKARQSYKYSVDNGYEPYWSLLFGNTGEEQILGEQFVAITEKTLMPIWSLYNG